MGDLTYVALRRIKVAGEYRQPGEFVPEAENWVNLPAYVSGGYIAPVPKTSVAAEGADSPASEGGGATGLSSPSATDVVASMTIDDIKERVQDGTLDAEEALTMEQAHQDRKTLVAWLEDRLEGESEEDGDEE